MFPLKGKIQHYAWGGKEFIPSLLGILNTEERPFAEYWLGVHPGAPATVALSSNAYTGLPELIKSEPRRYLGKRIAGEFHDLPFLLKVLDVRDMLSIQVHPSKEAAMLGFDRENELGIPHDALHRNYKDNNHKPEMMLALGDFWLLHGFKPEAELERVLESVEQLSPLLPHFRKHRLQGTVSIRDGIAAGRREQDVTAFVRNHLTPICIWPAPEKRSSFLGSKSHDHIS
jgi:mannose-6-phosphate isomerase